MTRNPQRRKSERGQAIVLIALMILVLVGMVGLAIDSGRGYVDRRELQDAVDAAALAAGDNFLNTESLASAESAASYQFGANMRLLGAESDSAWGSDNASASWAGYPGTFSISVTHNAFNGTDFLINGTHMMTLSFLQALGLGPQVQVASTAKTVVLSQTQTPALLTLSTTCASGTNASLFINGNANVAIVGAMYANGSVSSAASGVNVTVAGNAFDGQCQAPGGTIPNVTLICYNPNTNPPTSAGSPPCPPGTTLGQQYTGAPPLPDPGYSAPPLTGLTPQPRPGSTVEIQAGNYSADPFFNSVNCWFMDPGIYEWSGGFTLNHGLVSNELKSPDEARTGTGSTANPGFNAAQPTFTPDPGSNRASPNFWRGTGTDVVNCDGAFEVGAVTSHGGGVHPLTPAGSWGIIVTSLRFDSYKGVSYNRQSAPSICRTVAMDGHSTGFQVAVSNVPGAQYYDIFASPTGCGGPFGYAGSVNNPVASSNASTATCPSLPPVPGGNTPIAVSSAPGSIEPNPVTSGTINSCSMGYVVSDYIDSTNIGGGSGVGNGPFVPTSTYCPLPNGQFPPAFCQFPTGSPTAAGVGNDGGEQPPLNSSLPQESPIQDLIAYGGGDRANENECRNQTTSTVSSPCLGTTVTPGAVQFYFPPSQCLSIQGSTGSGYGDIFAFGGRQYFGIILYAPPQNTCSLMKLAGGSQTTFIGTTYMPGATFDVTGGAHSAVIGQVIVGQAKVDGSTGTAITYDPSLAPPAPGAKLIL